LHKNRKFTKKAFITATMSSSSMEAVRLNNESTLHMKNGDYSQAAVTLSSALAAIRSALRNETFPVAVPTYNTAANVLSIISHERGFFFAPRHAASRATSDLECGDWFLYEDAIEINPEHAFASEKSVEILSYAIIYNLGLCHHLQAVNELLKTSRSRNTSALTQSSLQRAVALYTQAQKLLVNHGLDNLEEMLHTMAITNNMGHAHHFLDNEPSAKICFERLLHAIMYISESGEQGRRVLLSHELCFDGFLTNVMNLVGTSSAAPAA
jgi:hypothetical protein